MKNKRFKFKFIVLAVLILELFYTPQSVYQHVVLTEIGSGPYIAKGRLCINSFGGILNFNKKENKA